jgi:hypothetical protein
VGPLSFFYVYLFYGVFCVLFILMNVFRAASILWE